MTTDGIGRGFEDHDPQDLDLDLDLDLDGEQESGSGDRWAMVLQERAALKRAERAGQRAAGWIRSLAGRWPDGHAELAGLADTVTSVMARIDPAGVGEIDAEAHYALTGRLRHTAALPGARECLTPAERVVLVAVGALVADSMVTVLGDFALALPLLCEAIDDALLLARP